MKRLILSFILLAGFAVLSVNSMAQVVIQNITYSHPTPPYTVTASGNVPPCGATTGTLMVNMVTSTLPAGTTYTIQAQSSLGYNQTNTQTTVTNNQLITQNYSGLAGSVSGVFYTIIIKTPKVPPSFNDSTYLAVVNIKVFSTKDFQAQLNKVDPLCPVPPNKGSASVNVLSGTAPYTYTWTTTPNPGNAPSAPNLDPGSYSVYVKDASGCDTTMPFTIVVQKPTVSLTSNPTGPICNPTFPLSISWTATPGSGWTPNPAGAYSWDGGVTFITSNTQTQSGITTYGNYSKNVIFKDINNCLSTQVTLSVPVDSRPTVTAVANPASVCPGTTTNITATIGSCSSIGGVTCMYSYDNGATYGSSNMYTTFSINQDTTVIVKVQNTSGCVSNPFPVAIDTTGKPKIIPVVSPSPICPNATYSITATCTKNCSAITMSFNGGAFVAGSPQTYNQPQAPLVASTTSFPMAAIGANGCRFDTTVTVTVFTNTLTISPPPAPICANNNGSTVTLTASGFKPATTITWASTPTGLPGDGSHATSIVVSSPTAGPISYMLSGTDINNCPRTVNQSITVNPQPTVTETGPAIHCEGTISRLTAAGASTYQWYNGTFTTLLSGSGSTFNVSPSATTTYGVIGTDANGCMDSATFVLNYHARPTGSASANPTAICSGNTVTITMTLDPPFNPDPVNGSYSINNGINYSTNPVFSGVGPLFSTTTINTMLQDNFGCKSSIIPVTITINPFHYKAIPSSPNCSYNSNGSILINNLVGGTSPNANYSINGGAYIPFTTSVTIPNLGVNTYAISVKDNSTPACSFDTSVAIASPPVLDIDTLTHTDVRCFGETNGLIPTKLVSVGTSDYDYYLNDVLVTANTTNANFPFSSLAANTYEVKVIDNNGCKDSVTNIQIKQPSGPITSPNITTSSACFGATNGSLSITSAALGGWGGYTYTINTTPPQSTTTVPVTYSNLAPASYTVSLVDSKGCPFTAPLAIVNAYPKITINANVVYADCNQPTGSLTVTGASGGAGPTYTFTKNGSPYTVGTAVTALGPGTTILMAVTDNVGCPEDSSFTILNIPRSIPIISIKAPTCPGGNDGSIKIDSVHVKIPGGEPFTYNLFSDKNPKVLEGTAGPSNANVAVTFASLMGGNHIMTISETTGGCQDYLVDSFRVYTSPTVYTVVKTPAPINTGFANMFVPQPSTFTTTSIAMASDIHESTGSVVIYDLAGGTPFLLSGKDAYDVSIDNPNALVTTALKDTTNGHKYITFSNLAPGPKTIYIRDANGCSDTIQIIVPGKFFIPNLVSPNGDSHNDAFEVVSLPDNSSLKILNRWGDRVYSSTNYDNKFDFHGLSDGIYYYDLEFTTGTKFKGWVQVLR